jgi:hypothetical protein
MTLDEMEEPIQHIDGRRGGGVAKPKKRGVRIPFVEDACGSRYDRSVIAGRFHGGRRGMV